MISDTRDMLHAIAEKLEAGEAADVQHLDKLPTLDVVNATELQGKTPPPREWLIENWLPTKCVTALNSDGGLGKSLMMLQAGTSIATGRPLLGLETKQAPVLLVFCEDDAIELHRRLAAICATEGMQPAVLSGLNFVSLCGFESSLLATREKGGELVRTGLFYAIRQKALDLGARFVGLDNLAFFYPGDENDRGQVTGFVNILNDLALAIDGAVLLVGHTPKSGAEFSGSTAWNNAVRSRWFFSRPTPAVGDLDEDDETIVDQRILRKGKSNYSRSGDEIALTWEKGVFHPTLSGGSPISANIMEQKLRERQLDVAFLAELDERNAQARPVSHSPNSPKSYAPKVFAKAKRFKDIKATGREIEQAMERLFNAGELLANELIGTNRKRRHKVYGIARNPAETRVKAMRRTLARTLRGTLRATCASVRATYGQLIENAALYICASVRATYL